MKALIQRAALAEVAVHGKREAKIDDGILLLLGVEKGDSTTDVDYLVKKSVGLRIFPDSSGKMNLSLTATKKGMLIVSQFTLAADCKKGTRPSFDRAEAPKNAERLYLEFVEKVRALGIHVETGIFGAYMQITLINDGPVTFMLESK